MYIEEVYAPSSLATKEEVILLVSVLAAGFPSPAEGYLESSLNLHEYLVEHPAATFFIRVSGDSMRDSGILSGDLLVVDRSWPIRNGSVVVSSVNGEFTVKHLVTRPPPARLVAANPAYESIVLTEEMDFFVWGVVRYAIHKVTT